MAAVNPHPAATPTAKPAAPNAAHPVNSGVHPNGSVAANKQQQKPKKQEKPAHEGKPEGEKS